MSPLLERVGDVKTFFSTESDPLLEQQFMTRQSIGRPLVDDETLTTLEHRLGRPLKPGKRSRPKTQKMNHIQQKLV